MTSREGIAGLNKLLEKTRGVNVVSPTWFALTDNEGNYSSLADQDYVKAAHDKGIQVWALLDNFSDDVQSEKLLASTSTRKKLIDSLMEDVEKYDLDGLNMDFDGLKLDESLITNLVGNRRSRVVAKAVIDICHQLGCSVLAESVETQDQLNVLQELGCDYAQGTLFNKPIKVETFEVRYLKE